MRTHCSVDETARSIGRILLTLALGILAAGCGHEPPAAPAPIPSAPAPAPTPGTVWGGTLTARNWPFSPFGLSLYLKVEGSTVTGGWSDLPWWDFGGSIAGTLDGTMFTGTVSINECKAEFRGSLTDRAATWTSAGVNEPCGPLFFSVPNPVDLTLQFSR